MGRGWAIFGNGGYQGSEPDFGATTDDYRCYLTEQARRAAAEGCGTRKIVFNLHFSAARRKRTLRGGLRDGAVGIPMTARTATRTEEFAESCADARPSPLWPASP